MADAVEIELLLERLDQIELANKLLRERLTEQLAQVTQLQEQLDKVQELNTQLGARADRLALHLQQGVEL